MKDLKKHLENSEKFYTFWSYFKIKKNKNKQYILLKVRKTKKYIFGFDYIRISISKQSIDDINSYGKFFIENGKWETFPFPFNYIYWSYENNNRDTIEEVIEFLSNVVKNPLLP